MLAHEILPSLAQAAMPFVLVVGLVLIGAVAQEDGLFEAFGARLGGTRLSPHGLLLALLALVALVTAILNLDTSVVFLTPVLVHAARRRGLDERPFLYGSVFMANAASVLLPGSNLTNLLVLRDDPRRATAIAQHMLPAWLVSCAVTAAFVLLAFRIHGGRRDPASAPPLRLRLGAVTALAAALVVLALPCPALPVLGLGVAAAAVRRIRPRIDWRALVMLFALVAAVGTLARAWHTPSRLLAARGTWSTAATGAAASIVVNNLPASVLLSAGPLAHPDALLLGLDLGPNLAITGSLSALLWLQAARTVGARPSIGAYSRYGLALAPASLVAALAVWEL